MSAEEMRFKRQHLPVGDDQIPLVVASEGSEPKAVVMSYEAFLELAATLYTAVETMRTAGIEPSSFDADEDDEEADRPSWRPTAEDLAEFASWDAGLEARPRLRLVVGG